MGLIDINQIFSLHLSQNNFISAMMGRNRLKNSAFLLLMGLTFAGFLIAAQCSVVNRAIGTPMGMNHAAHMGSEQHHASVAKQQHQPEATDSMFCCLDLKLVFKLLSDWAPLVVLGAVGVFFGFRFIDVALLRIPSQHPFLFSPPRNLVDQKVLLLC